MGSLRLRRLHRSRVLRGSSEVLRSGAPLAGREAGCYPRSGSRCVLAPTPTSHSTAAHATAAAHSAATDAGAKCAAATNRRGPHNRPSGPHNHGALVIIGRAPIVPGRVEARTE